MSVSPLLVERVAEALRRELEEATRGHCLRVDHLTREDAHIVCRRLRAAHGPGGGEAFVLDPSPTANALSIRPERAIEIRNRKESKLCLFVPADLVDPSASSLANSFASFDLEACFRAVSKDLLLQLPEEVRRAARQVLAVLRGSAKPAAEDWADFLGTVLEGPCLERLGRELWRIGLIPDIGSERLPERLEHNRRCVQALVRPARAQTSPEERLHPLGLRRGAVRDELLAYLEGKRLRDSKAWLCEMAKEPYLGRITFERWAFEESANSDLEAIEVAPLLDRDGQVERYTRLLQPGGLGTQPVAPVGPRSKVTIRWTSIPTNPSNIKRWRAELIPSREEHTEEELGGIELPALMTAGRTRRVSIPLDLDLETIPVRAVQIRVVALDERESELRGADGKVIIEGLSDEFWLSEEAPQASDTKKKRDAVPTLPYARLKAAVELRVDSIEEAPGQWSEHDLHYYSITLNGRRTSRIALSPILRALEERSLGSPDEVGLYRARTSVSERLDPEHGIQPVGSTALEGGELAPVFLARRRELFRLLERQGHRGLVETAEWNPELSRRARAYAKAYRDVLAQATSRELLSTVLAVDTLHLAIEHTHGWEEALLLLPTHPVRILWYAAYADLLRHWEEELLKSEKDRRRLLDLEFVERVAPLNCPAFVADRNGSVFLFAQNLRFFWGLALPVDARDPARRIAEVARIVGFQEDEASLADLPPRRLSEELQTYREVHPYLQTLRLNLLNPGSGSFVAESLRALYESTVAGQDEDGDLQPPPRLELIAHAHEPIPSQLPALAELQRELYDAQPRGRRHHLAPLFSMAIRPMDQAKRIPGGDVNLSLVIDQLPPTIQAVDLAEHEDSSSFHGLLVRFLPHFKSSESGSVWQHRLSFPLQASRERHPVFGPYTNDLVDSHREYLGGIARLLDPVGARRLPAVVVELSPEERLRIDSVHHLSDWVITLDRFFGVEFYDDPADPNLSRVARKYLLDYAPEFLEGLGHRMLVTTAHREEVEEILCRAMRELGFGMVEESVGEVLEHLKTISGRLALRILGDDARAREAVSLGVVAAYLRARGELDDSILVPVDSHPELFGPTARQKRVGVPRARCDLLRVRVLRSRLVATFIEVKSRAATGQSEELLNRIVDQIEATEEVFRDLFFRKDPVRLDHVLQRSRLVTILRFYLRRARRYGLIKTEERFQELEGAIGRLESGIPDLRAERWGFVVNLAGKPQRAARVRETEISFLTARDLAEAGLSVQKLADDDKIPPTPPELPPSEPPTAKEEGPTPTRKPQEAGRLRISPVPSPGAEAPTFIEVNLGLTVADQEPVFWKPSVRGSPHLFVLGIPGQGKSWTVTRILCELARRELTGLVIDFHGQFGDSSGLYAHAASPTVLDAAQGLPFSPFEAESNQTSGTSFWRTNCFAVAEIFQYVCELGDIQRDVIYEALRDCYRDLGFEEGKVERLPTVDEVRRRLGELESERGIRNVLPRCRPLLDLGLFRDAGDTSAEFRELLRGGLVVDIHSLGLETLQLAAGAFLLRKVYKDMFRWGEADRLRLTIVLDEAHRLARDITLPKIMKEGRKFGIAVVVASQGLADYHPDVVGNAGTKIVFRTNFPMSKKVAGFLRTRKGVDLAAAIEQLDVGEAYVQTPDMSTCARVRMHRIES